jgi:hypothetical protein
MSLILSSLEDDKVIIIVGGVYNLASGKVDWHWNIEDIKSYLAQKKF